MSGCGRIFVQNIVVDMDSDLLNFLEIRSLIVWKSNSDQNINSNMIVCKLQSAYLYLPSSVVHLCMTVKTTLGISLKEYVI
jgi:hypothetical protein